jgi:hypothetical protein
LGRRTAADIQQKYEPIEAEKSAKTPEKADIFCDQQPELDLHFRRVCWPDSVLRVGGKKKVENDGKDPNGVDERSSLCGYA